MHAALSLVAVEAGVSITPKACPASEAIGSHSIQYPAMTPASNCPFPIGSPLPTRHYKNHRQRKTPNGLRRRRDRREITGISTSSDRLLSDSCQPAPLVLILICAGNVPSLILDLAITRGPAQVRAVEHGAKPDDAFCYGHGGAVSCRLFVTAAQYQR